MSETQHNSAAKSAANSILYKHAKRANELTQPHNKGMAHRTHRTTRNKTANQTHKICVIAAGFWLLCASRRCRRRWRPYCVRFCANGSRELSPHQRNQKPPHNTLLYCQSRSFALASFALQRWLNSPTCSETNYVKFQAQTLCTTHQTHHSQQQSGAIGSD